MGGYPVEKSKHSSSPFCFLSVWRVVVYFALSVYISVYHTLDRVALKVGPITVKYYIVIWYTLHLRADLKVWKMFNLLFFIKPVCVIEIQTNSRIRGHPPKIFQLHVESEIHK